MRKQTIRIVSAMSKISQCTCPMKSQRISPMRKVHGLYDIYSLRYDSLLFLFSVVFLTIAQRSNPVKTVLIYFPLLSKTEPVCVQQAVSLKASYESHHSNHYPKMPLQVACHGVCKGKYPK